MSDSTIKDVARFAGVSIATVSRVINGNYYVSPDIEKKVREAISELNYFPNSVARSLKNDNTHTIGILVSDISNSYFTSMARALEDVVNEHNYNIIMCSTEDDRDRERSHLRLLAGRKIDGLIINTTGKNDDFITALSANIPVVLVNRRIHNTNFSGDFIDSSNADGAGELTSHLISHGHRKIGVINGDLSVSTGRERFKGFVSAMRKTGITVDEGYPYRFDGQFLEESGYQGAAQLMGMTDPPTGIVIMNNSMAIGAIKYFKNNGIRVPEDVSIASYGNIENIELMYIQPSIVTLDARAVGNNAGKLILDRIKNRSVKNREVIFPAVLIVGNSVLDIGDSQI